MATSDRFGAARYSPNWRGPRTPYGNIVPNVTHSSSERPHSDVAAAAWLPLNDSTTNRAMGFFVRQEEPTGDQIVITPGKAVAVTRENLGLAYDEGPVGRLVPAGVRVNWGAAAGVATVLEYTTVDATQGIQDLATGLPVAGAVTYTKTALAAALVTRGLLRPSESLEDFISKPIGLIPQSAYAWAGGDGLQPAGYRYHGYKRQHKSQLVCDWVFRFPFVPAYTETSVEIPAIGTTVAAIAEVETAATAPSTSAHAGLGAANADQDGAWLTGAGGELAAVGLSTRYGTPSHSDYVGLVLGAYRIEAAPHIPINIYNTAGTDKTSSVMVRRVASINDLSYDGDYYVDLEPGIIFFYESGGNALPSGLAATDYILVKEHAAHTEYISDLASIVGDVRPGDLLVVDAKSNLRPFVPRPAETQVASVGSTDYVDPSTYDRPEDVVAQVLTFSRYPDESMDKVKTFYDNLPTGLADQMPGSATEGYTDNLTYASGGQFEVIVNFLK